MVFGSAMDVFLEQINQGKPSRHGVRFDVKEQITPESMSTGLWGGSNIASTFSAATIHAVGG
jgi:hypothetical protein